MKAFGLGLAMAGVLLAGTAMAQAQGDGMGVGRGPGFGEHRPPMERAFGPEGAHGRWWNNPKVVEQLKLTDEQRKAFDGILLEHREKLIDLRANEEKAELAMESLVNADQQDEAPILAQIDKVAQARAELEKANARFLLAIRNKLTPEQWKQIKAFRADHGQERGSERGQGRGGWERGDRGREGHGPDGPRRDGQGPDGWKQGGQHHQGPPPQVAPPPPPPAQPGAEPQAPVAPGAGAEQ
jgi:periplasmic protein CpxP/Spy